MKEGDIIQVAHVVRDIDRAMKHYWEVLGIGPWDVYTFAPPQLREATYRGEPTDHTFALAVTWVNSMQCELMAPLTGRSLYDDHLEQHGEGFHHIKRYYADCTKALEEFKAKGIDVLQSGKIGEDEYYYLDTESTVGVVIEIGNNGRIPPPERRYPA